MTSPRLSASGSLTLTIITSAVTTGITAEDITGGITVASKPNGGIRHDTVTLSFPAKLGDREGSIGVGEGSVWVTDKQLLTRFNAASGAEEAKIELPGEGAGVAVAFGSVWITSPRKNALYRIDPKTNAVTQTAALESRPRFLTADQDSLWILDHGGFVQAVNGKTGEVTATIETGPLGGGGDIDVGGGFIWATSHDIPLMRVDPQSKSLVAKFHNDEVGDALCFGRRRRVDFRRRHLPRNGSLE